MKSGFYAAAYDLGGTTVISYRGTDHPDLSSASDILNGWVIATGVDAPATHLHPSHHARA